MPLRNVLLNFFILFFSSKFFLFYYNISLLVRRITTQPQITLITISTKDENLQTFYKENKLCWKFWFLRWVKTKKGIKNKSLQNWIENFNNLAICKYKPQCNFLEIMRKISNVNCIIRRFEMFETKRIYKRLNKNTTIKELFKYNHICCLW